MDAAMLDPLLRWAHIVAIMIWVGHNYASVVQRPSYRPLTMNDLTTPGSERMMAILAREHGIFRWASIVALATGLGMLHLRGWLPGALTLQNGLAPIGVGVYLGIIMVLNLWLVLWPHQKKLLGFVAADTEERLRCSRITHLSSRTNTMLSIPTLFFMVAGSHGAALLG
jgi:uncharacterized membrane protein